MKTWRYVLITILSTVMSASATERILASSPGDFTLRQADEVAPTLVEILAQTNPWGIALDPESGTIFWSDATAETVFSLPLSNLSASPQVVISQTGAVYHGIAWDSSSSLLLILDSATDSLIRVDPFAPVVPDVVPWNSTRPCDLALSNDKIFSTDSGDDTIVIANLDGSNPMALGGPPTEGIWGIAVHPLTGEIFYSTYTQGKIFQFFEDSQMVVQVASGLDGPRGLSFDRKGNLFCLEAGQNRVVRINLSLGTFTPTSYASALNGRALLVFEDEDRDGDFLPDDLEIAQLGSISVSDGSDDLDSDGLTVSTELLLNRDPNSADGGPFRTFSEEANGDISLEWHTLVGNDYDYQVRYSRDMINWSPLGPIFTTSPVDSFYESRSVTIDPSSLFLTEPEGLFFRIEIRPQ